MTTFADAVEIHIPLFTVKLQVPATKPEILVEVPVPVILPGFIVQLPAGNPLNITLPVATVQVGCVMVPTVGVVGIEGCVLMTTLEVGTEVQPEELVTVKLYVPEINPEMDVLVVDPAIAPGLIVQLPAGKPLNITLPVASVQLG